MTLGTVHRTGGGVYRVALDDGRVVEASLRGRLKLESRVGDAVVVGDRVEVAEEDTGALTVEAVLPRERELIRRGRGGRKAKVLAANVDRMVLVAAARDPEPRPEQLDRYLAIAEVNGLDAVVVLNKLDLPGAEEAGESLREIYEGPGYPVIQASAVTGLGLDELREVLCAGTSVLVGPSGVGKSSLLNAAQPGLDLRVGELSRKRGSGRHTTVRSRLIPLECGGAVADTPGFSEVALWGVEPPDVDHCFPEVRELLGECRFRGCSHSHEPDCAVRAAVEAGEIAPTRYESYRALLKEAQEAWDSEY